MLGVSYRSTFERRGFGAYEPGGKIVSIRKP